MKTFNPHKLLLLAVKSAVEAGRLILDVYNSNDFEVKLKSDASPLTLADRKAHDKITERLTTTRIPILSEEGRHVDYEERSLWQYFWLVDPLDGTKEFIKRNGEFTVNIALIHQQKPVMGVIYVPVSDELYFAEEHTGSYKLEGIAGHDVEHINMDDLLSNAERLPVHGIKHKFTIVASRSHMNKETEDYIAALKLKHGDINIISRGSALKICMVAEGKADIYPRFGPTMEWDTAAGHAIVLSAGGVITKQDERELLEYNKRDLLNSSFIVKL